MWLKLKYPCFRELHPILTLTRSFKEGPANDNSGGLIEAFRASIRETGSRLREAEVVELFAEAATLGTRAELDEPHYRGHLDYVMDDVRAAALEWGIDIEAPLFDRFDQDDE